MPRRDRKYSQREREFVYALALCTGKPFTHLEPILHALAQSQALGFLGPKANQNFLDFCHQRGYSWAKRYGWDLAGLQVDAPQEPLPAEEIIDDDLLSERLAWKKKLVEKFHGGEGDVYQLTNAFLKVGASIEGQIIRRMSRSITPQTVIDLVLEVFAELGPKLDPVVVLEAVTRKVSRYRYLPEPEAA